MKFSLIKIVKKNQIYETIKKDLLNLAEKSIKKRGKFLIVLTGGNSIYGLYSLLSNQNINFKKWKFFITDERNYPLNSRERNDNFIKKILFKRKKIISKNVIFFKPELGLNVARSIYEKKIRGVRFDLALLSIGEDGHVASLFSNKKNKSSSNVIIERNSPKLPKERISLSLKALNNSKNIFKLVIGKSKKKVVKKIINNKNIIANKIRSNKEVIYIEKNLIY